MPGTGSRRDLRGLYGVCRVGQADMFFPAWYRMIRVKIASRTLGTGRRGKTRAEHGNMEPIRVRA